MDWAVAAKGVAALAALSLVISGARPRGKAPAADPEVQGVLAVLPGANCGACGNTSCFAAAKAIAAWRAPADTCVAGGAEVALAVEAVLRGAQVP